jgi:hypothetical protein
MQHSPLLIQHNAFAYLCTPCWTGLRSLTCKVSADVSEGHPSTTNTKVQHVTRQKLHKDQSLPAVSVCFLQLQCTTVSWQFSSNYMHFLLRHSGSCVVSMRCTLCFVWFSSLCKNMNIKTCKSIILLAVLCRCETLPPTVHYIHYITYITYITLHTYIHTLHTYIHTYITYIHTYIHRAYCHIYITTNNCTR